MPFTQLITVRTQDPDAVRAIHEEWLAATEGRRTARSARLFADRHHEHRYVVVVDFDSAEAAEVNGALPETTAAAERLAAVADEVTYTDLDLVDAGAGVL